MLIERGEKYADETATVLAEELLSGADEGTVIAVISAPSVFVQVRNILVSGSFPVFVPLSVFFVYSAQQHGFLILGITHVETNICDRRRSGKTSPDRRSGSWNSISGSRSSGKTLCSTISRTRLSYLVSFIVVMYTPSWVVHLRTALDI